jgi:hypothetical protein
MAGAGPEGDRCCGDRSKLVVLTSPDSLPTSDRLRIEVEVWPDDKPADLAMHDRPVAEVTEVFEAVKSKLASLQSPSEPTYRCRVLVNGSEIVMDVIDPTPELAPQVVTAVTHILLTYTMRQMI